jgi:hypothetical protein
MNYKRHYDLLIDRAKSRKLYENKETHHIVPRCMGGTNDKSNLVDLTTEEHYVTHQILIKIYPNIPALIFAAHMMTAGRNSNKTYGWLRRLHVEALRKINTGRKVSDETRAKMSLSKKGKIGKKHTIESKEKISKTSSERRHAAETKQKIADANIGSVRTEETKMKISLSLTGKEKSEQAKKNMRKPKQNYISKKGVPTGVATTGCFEKGNMPWNKGITHPCKEETRMKIKEANRGRKRLYNDDGSWTMIKVEA